MLQLICLFVFVRSFVCWKASFYDPIGHNADVAAAFPPVIADGKAGGRTSGKTSAFEFKVHPVSVLSFCSFVVDGSFVELTGERASQREFI